MIRIVDGAKAVYVYDDTSGLQLTIPSNALISEIINLCETVASEHHMFDRIGLAHKVMSMAGTTDHPLGEIIYNGKDFMEVLPYKLCRTKHRIAALKEGVSTGLNTREVYKYCNNLVVITGLCEHGVKIQGEHEDTVTHHNFHMLQAYHKK